MIVRVPGMMGAAVMLLTALQGATDGSADGRQPAISGPWTDMYGEAQHPGASYRVRLFVHAAQACLHFAGEEAYDAERGAFLTAMMDETCTGLKERYTAIIADPLTDAASRRLVEAAWEPLRE